MRFASILVSFLIVKQIHGNSTQIHYQQTISTTHGKNVLVSSLKDAVGPSYPNIGPIQRMTEVLFLNQSKSKEIAVRKQSSIKQCKTSSSGKKGFSDLFCFNHETSQLFTTDLFEPTTAMEVQFTLKLHISTFNENVTILYLRVSIKVQPPCSAQNHFYNIVNLDSSKLNHTEFCSSTKLWKAYVKWWNITQTIPKEKLSCLKGQRNLTKLYQKRCLENTSVHVKKNSTTQLYGGNVVLTCITSDIFIPYSYAWYKTIGGSTNQLFEAVNKTYTGSKLTYIDIGSYTCEIQIPRVTTVRAKNHVFVFLEGVNNGALKFELHDYHSHFAIVTSKEYKNTKSYLQEYVMEIFDNKDHVHPNNPRFEIFSMKNSSSKLAVTGELYMMQTHDESLTGKLWLKDVENKINLNNKPSKCRLKNVQVFGYRVCADTVKRSANSYKYAFSSVHVGDASMARCPSSKGFAILKCIHSKWKYAVWRNFNDSLCDDEKIVDKTLTSGMESLAKTNITLGNALDLSANLRELSKHVSQNGSTYDVSLFGEIIYEFIDVLATDITIADNIFNSINMLLDSDGNVMEESEAVNRTSTKVLKFLTTAAVTLMTNKSINITQRNYALLGIKFSRESFKSTKFTLNRNTNMNLKVDNSGESSLDSEIVIRLPKSMVDVIPVTMIDLDITVLAFQSNKLFSRKNDSSDKLRSFVVNSNIIAVDIHGQPIKNLKEPVVMEFNTRRKDLQSHAKMCSYWNHPNQTWSTDGCHLYSEDLLHNKWVCHCTHLTNFAILFNTKPPSASHQKYLSMITYVGLSLSLIGAALTFLAHAVFPVLRETTPPKLLMNLCIAVSLMSIVFICGVINRGYTSSWCSIIAGLTHYVFITIIFWGAIEAFHSARSLVFPMKSEIRNFVPKAMIIGWGVPAIFPLIGGLTMPHDYGGYGIEKSCVVSGVSFYSLQLVPILLVVVCNVVALGAIMMSLHSGSKGRSSNALQLKDRLRIVVAFMILFGISWIFGVLVIQNDIELFQYIFCILSSVQGLYIFGFYCIRNVKIRNYARYVITGKSLNDGRSLSKKRKKGNETLDTALSIADINSSVQYKVS